MLAAVRTRKPQTRPMSTPARTLIGRIIATTGQRILRSNGRAAWPDAEDWWPSSMIEHGQRGLARGAVSLRVLCSTDGEDILLHLLALSAMLTAGEERLRILRAKQAFGRRIRRRKPACLDCMRSGSPDGIDALLAIECAIVKQPSCGEAE